MKIMKIGTGVRHKRFDKRNLIAWDKALTDE
jgi:hypothetical protein